MKWIKAIKVNDSIIEKLKLYSTVRTYNLKAPLFYEGQIPIVAFLVLKGSIQTSKKKKLQNILRAGSIIGADEVLHLKPSEVSAEVSSNTTLCFLDRTTLIEIDRGEMDEFKQLLVENAREEVS